MEGKNLLSHDLKREELSRKLQNGSERFFMHKI